MFKPNDIIMHKKSGIKLVVMGQDHYGFKTYALGQDGETMPVAVLFKNLADFEIYISFEEK